MRARESRSTSCVGFIGRERKGRDPSGLSIAVAAPVVALGVAGVVVVARTAEAFGKVALLCTTHSFGG